MTSAGMSGTESLAGTQRIWDINVVGTHNLIKACVACSVPKVCKGLLLVPVVPMRLALAQPIVSLQGVHAMPCCMT